MADDPLIGTQVGNYKIVGLLGEGGMARVYRAAHPDIGREVAIKVLSAQVAAMPDVVRRFRVEAQTVNKIDHPNIIHIFDFGNLPDGRQFYLMELLAGESLADRIERGGAMPLDEALTVTDSILDALDAVHRAGIVHRDLKPDNVFLSQSGGRRIVKLLDFGIVKLLGDQPFDKTQTGSLLGTPSYMAPEQCQGKVSEIGPRTDIYAVGCILYQMLSGALPFNADSLGGLLLQHMTETPRPLTDRIRGLPLVLSQLVQQCLEKDANRRPPSAAWLREQIRPFLAQGRSLVVAETVAAMAGSAPHAQQTIASLGGPPHITPPSGTPRVTPPSGTPVPPAAPESPPHPHTMPMSSIPTPTPTATPTRSRLPVVAIGAIVGVATIAIILVAVLHKSAAPTRSDGAVQRPPDAAVVSDSQPLDTSNPDASLDAAPLIDAAVDASDHPPTLKERLESLKRMCDDGVFSADECKTKRADLMRAWDRGER